MRRYLLLFLIVFLPVCSGAQVVAIMNTPEGNILHMCIDNHIKVAVEGLKSNEIVVQSSSGIVKPSEYGGPGNYIIHTEHAGKLMVYVGKKMKNGHVKPIDSVLFRVKRLPYTRPSIGAKYNGDMEQDRLLIQIGIGSWVACCDIERFTPIQGFTTIVTRNGVEIFRRRTNEDNRFDSITRDFFYDLHDFDHLIFNDITAKDCDNAIRPLESIDLIINHTHEYEKNAGWDTIGVVDPISGEEILERRWTPRKRKSYE